jgi:hypothetical protein
MAIEVLQGFGTGMIAAAERDARFYRRIEPARYAPRRLSQRE